MESRLVIARAKGGDGGRKELGTAVGAQREGILVEMFLSRILIASMSKS